MAKNRFWTVVFMVGNVPCCVRRYKSLKNADAAIGEWTIEVEGENANEQQTAYVVKTDFRASHKKKEMFLPLVYVRTNGPVAHLAVASSNDNDFGFERSENYTISEGDVAESLKITADASQVLVLNRNNQ
jgi:hypothetical protein